MHLQIIYFPQLAGITNQPLLDISWLCVRLWDENRNCCERFSYQIRWTTSIQQDGGFPVKVSLEQFYLDSDTMSSLNINIKSDLNKFINIPRQNFTMWVFLTFLKKEQGDLLSEYLFLCRPLLCLIPLVV